MRALFAIVVGRPLGLILGTAYWLFLHTINFGRRRRTYSTDGTLSLWTLRARGLPSHVVAITFGRRVFARPLFPTLSQVRHETAHVKQYQRLGWLGFLMRYGEEIVRYGYAGAPLEHEARV